MQTDFQSIMQQATQYLMPEGILTLFACAALVLDVMLPRNHKHLVAWVSLAGVLLTLVSVLVLASGLLGFDVTHFGFLRDAASRTGFFNMIVIDAYAVVFKLIFLVGAALSILLSMKY